MITVPVNGWTRALLGVVLAIHAYWALVGLIFYAGYWTPLVMLVALALRLWIVMIAGIYLFALGYLGWGAVASGLLAMPSLLAGFWKSWRPYVRFEKA